MDWWAQVLTTGAGAIVGGSVVIASDAMRHKANREMAAEDRRHEAEQASERWRRERQTVRNDDQRQWILDLQDAVQRYSRLTSRVIQADLAHHREHPDEKYSSNKIDEELNLEFFEASTRLHALNARISDGLLSESVDALVTLCASITMPGATAAEADTLLRGGFSQPLNDIHARVRDLLSEL